MAVTIININDTTFSINGINYIKNFISVVSGDLVRIQNVYDGKLIIQANANYVDYTVGGSSFGSASLLQTSLIEVLFNRDLQGFENRVSTNESDIINLQENQVTGVETYTELTDLPVTGVLLVSYKVTNDTVSDSNNGFYHWSGSVYIKDAEINQDIIDDAIELERVVKNFPLKEDADGTTPVNVDVLREFLIDGYVRGTYDTTKTYSIAVIGRNTGGEWLMDLIQADGAPGAILKVASFSTLADPEIGDNITIHELSEFGGSGISGSISVNWSKLPVGIYSTMYDFKGFGLDPRFFVENNPTQKVKVTEAGEINVVKDESTFVIENTRINDVTFLHPRGLSEYEGNNTYSNQGVAVPQYPLGYRTIVKRIKFSIYGDSEFSGVVEVRKLTSANSEPSANTLVEAFNFAVGEFNQDSSVMSDVVLTDDLMLEANEYLTVFVIDTTGNSTIKRWDINDTSPVRIPFYFKSSGNWFSGSSTFLSPSLLLFSDEYTDEESRTNINSLTDRVSLLEGEVRLILPDTIKAVVGYKQQLFYRGIIEDIDINKYNIKITGDVDGKQFPRYYEFTPSSAGTKTFTISIYDKADNLINTASCSVVIAAAKTTNPSTKKILCLGDSLTAGGEWTGELLRMLSQSGGTPAGLNLPNIDFIGTVDKGSGNRFEGYGGKTWDWFISETLNTDAIFTVASHDKDGSDLVSIWIDDNARQWKLETILGATSLEFSRVGHSSLPPASGDLTHVSGGVHTSTIVYSSFAGGAVNPFYNVGAGQLDIANYISINGFSTVDVVYALMTWNTMDGRRQDAIDHDTLITRAKIWIDDLHSSFPICKVKLMGIQLPSINGGLAASYGDANSGYGNYYDLVLTVNGLNLAYQDLANEPAYSGFVEFLNVSIQFDNENNMPEALEPVNSRSSKTELRGTNGVHPTDDGYGQIADVAFKDANTI